MPSSSRQFAKHVRISSTEDLSYTVPASGSGNGQANEAIQTIVTGRKCWKTIKGKGEVVWPPYLEAALVQGLEKYTPVETRSSRALGRFPMRNKFISDHIFKITGKRRTPKQVGSRLQQLRDTCEGKRILKLLSKRPGDLSKVEEDEPLEETRIPESSTPTPTPPPQGPPRDSVRLDVLLPDAPWSSSAADARYSLASDASPSSSKSSPFPSPRPLRYIDPTVTFRSGSPISAYSSFRVTKNNVVVHSEMTELELRSSSCMPASPSSQWPSEMECTFLYSTTLVPHFWHHLCEAADPGAYTIMQEIVRSTSTSLELGANSSSSYSQAGDILFSVDYQFSTTQSTPPQSPESVHPDSLSFTAESSSDVDSEIDEMAMYNAFRDPALVAASPALSHASHTSVLHPSQSLTTYELPPDLIRDGEDGYASLPQSPLDATFPVIGSGIAIGAGADLNESVCRNYVDYAAVGFDSLGVSTLSGGLTSVDSSTLIVPYAF